MNRHCPILCLLVLVALAVLPGQLVAGPLISESDTRTCSILFENDMFGTTDRYYTNGIKASCLSKDVKHYAEVNRYAAWLNQIVGKMPLLKRVDRGDGRKILTVGASVGQKIYTPADIQQTALITDDRPYAGWLYFGTGIHARDERQMHMAELVVGLVGPAALGEWSQNTIHKLRDIPEAQGWDNQLDNELAFMLVVERRNKSPRYDLASGFQFDMIGHYGGALGTVYTYLNAGAELRYGWKIPKDFGTALIRPGGDAHGPMSGDERFLGGIAAYGFVAGSGRYVVRNIFLDGNTFEGSHSVEKRPWVGDLVLGAGITWSNYKLTFSRVLRTREFEGQPKLHNFGSINLSVTF